MFLEADGIQLSYGLKKVLQDIYIRVEKGEVVGLLGLNGTGKSSLLQIIYGLTPAYCSSIRINGSPFRNMWQYPLKMKMLPQFHFIPGNKTVREALMDYGLTAETFIEYFPEFEVLIDTKMGEMSGGQKRILECFLILKSESDFKLLDEPFSSLSPIYIEALKSLIGQTKAKSGCIISDHYYRDILSISDRVYLLRNHRLLEVKENDSLNELGYLP